MVKMRLEQLTTNVLHFLKNYSFKARFHYERGKEHSLFVLLIFFALASILTARFNQRWIKETKNALFHARSGNGPLASNHDRSIALVCAPVARST